MGKLLVFFIIVCGSFIFIHAQAVPATDKAKEEKIARENEFNRRVDNLRNIDKPLIRVDPNQNSQVYLSKIKPLYRIPNDAEKSLLAPDREDIQTYADFLHDKNTGLVKLIIDKGCSKNFTVVVSTPHCLKYTMPGAGSSYSFRMENHWLQNLSDLNFADKVFQSSLGILTHGIMVNIGDIQLNKVNSQNAALQTLSGFQPVTDFDQAKSFAGLLEKGIEDNQYVYGSVLPVKENSTYLLRSIAYKGESFRTMENIDYNELDFDKRKDIIVAFRVVRFIPDESVTILWKMLDKKDSPKINNK